MRPGPPRLGPDPETPIANPTRHWNIEWGTYLSSGKALSTKKRFGALALERFSFYQIILRMTT